MMNIDLKKSGALSILATMLFGLISFANASLEEIKEKNNLNEKRIIILEEHEKTSIELLKEVRNDVRLLLNKRR